MSKKELKNVKIFTREEMVENRSNIYDSHTGYFARVKGPDKNITNEECS